jgi:hypothetical protein
VLGTGLGYVPELIGLKRAAEHGPFPPGVKVALERDVARLHAELEAARDASRLPDKPTLDAVEALHQLVVRVRLG